MLFTNPKNNSGKILYLGQYHPWHGGSNPAFDEFSGRILDVKDIKAKGIDFFHQRLEPKLLPGITIVVFPSAAPATVESGLMQIAKRLVANERVDGTTCLRRHTAVPKSATGGQRNEAKHLNSIVVENRTVITGKNVLLLDDVTTSGSSIRAGLQLLRAHAPAYLQALCLAKTV